VNITSPHGFRERFLLMGGGGAGKTTAALSMIDASGQQADVIDLDYSQAWERGIALDFPSCEDRVHVHSVLPDWSDFIDKLEEIVDQHGDDKARWLVIDSVSPTWELVQSWYIGIAVGTDLGQHMAELRRDSENLKAYQASIVETMNWPAVKKEYGRLWRAIMSWKGHLILTAEVKAMKGEKDAEVIALYGQLGYKPVGEARLHHVTSSTFLLQHDSRGYRYTTVKDRGREDQEGEEVAGIDDGGFAQSYLRDVAGWKLDRSRVAKQLTVEGEE